MPSLPPFLSPHTAYIFQGSVWNAIGRIFPPNLWPRLRSLGTLPRDIQDLEVRRHVQFVLSLVMILLPIAILVVIIPPLTEPGRPVFSDTDVLGVLGGMIPWTLAVILLRRGAYKTATLLLTSGAFLAIFIAVFTRGDLMDLTFLILPLILASAVLPLRTVLALVGINLLLLVTLTLRFRSTSFFELVFGPVAFILFGTVLLLASVRHREQLAQDRQAALQESEARYRSIAEQLRLRSAALEAAANAILLIDREGVIEWCNPAFTELTGYTYDEIQGQPLQVLHSDLEHAAQFIDLWQTIQGGEVWRGEIMNRRKNGDPYIEAQTITPVKNEEGEISHFVAVKEDVTARKLMERQLAYEASHDMLTGLPNRAYFERQLQQVLDHAPLYPETLFAVLFLDFDHFKEVNDRYGHAMGDRLLVAIAHRLQNCLRPQDVVARLGGDEFTILLMDMDQPGDAFRIAQRLCTQLNEPFFLAEEKIQVSVSVGIAMGHADYEKPAHILRDADAAMYRAKALGRNQIQISPAPSDNFPFPRQPMNGLRRHQQASYSSSAGTSC